MLTITLPVSGVSVWVPGILLLGLAIGFLTGMFGVGGGFLLTPLLKIVFGLPYPIAVGSGLVQIFLAGSFSAYKHWRLDNVDTTLGIVVATGGLAGTELGVRALGLLGSRGDLLIHGRSIDTLDFTLTVLFLVLMVIVAGMILWETSSSGAAEVDTALTRASRKVRIPPVLSFSACGIPAMSMWVPLILSFAVGILTGLLGIGGGFVNFPILVYGLGVPTVMAVGTSAFQIVFASAYGALRHAFLGHVEPLLVGMLLASSLVGVNVGVRITDRGKGATIRRYFALVLGAGIAVVAFDLVRSIW